MCIIIGLSGKARAGKDSMYEAISHVSKLEVRRIALADPLKDEVYKYVLKPHGVERSALDDERKKYFRLILQGWGTDFKRNFFGQDYWVQRLEAKLNSPQFRNFKGIVCITDIRFREEADFVRERGGYVVRINRPKKGLKAKLLSFFSKKDGHSSECALDKYEYFDYVVKNSKALIDLDGIATNFIDEFDLNHEQ